MIGPLATRQRGEDSVSIEGVSRGSLQTKRAKLSLRPLIISQLHALQGADFVAGWVTQIGKVHGTHGARAHARRIFTGCAAIGDACGMPSIALFRAVDRKANCAAIGTTGGFAINGLCNGENALGRHVKHTTLIVLRARAESGQVELVVEDRGPGIPPEALSRLGEPFFRPESARARETGGAGLGLAIVRAAVEACGGTVDFANRDPSGLRVTLRLAQAELVV